MTDYHHPQPWRTFTTPLTIPHPRSHDPFKYPYSYHPYQPYHTPYSAWRSPTPPSLSPSPSPSTTSTTSTHSNIEIEELENENDTDSGVELLVGEYEEAPENYGCLVYDSDVDSDDEEEDADVDIAASHNSILYGFERLNARTSPVMGVKGAKGGKTAVCGFPIPRRSKRSYAESEVSSSVEERSWWGDSGLESEEEGGRRVRRRVVRRVNMDEEDCVSVKSWGEDADSDNEIDMEL